MADNKSITSTKKQQIKSRPVKRPTKCKSKALELF